MKHRIATAALLSTVTLGLLSGPAAAQKGSGYVMVTFLSGIDYWKDAYRGMQAAGKELGVSTTYTGSVNYELNDNIATLEQVIARKPAGILLTVMNADALRPTIDKAIKAGIPVVTFDADSPKSNRYAFLGTGNERAGAEAARYLCSKVSSGEVAISSVPAQQNHVERRTGFTNYLKANCPNLKIVATTDDKTDSSVAAREMASVLQAHPNIKGIFATDAAGGVGVAQAVKEARMNGKIKIVSFDYDEGTLDNIDKGVIDATVAQGTWQMGYWGLKMLDSVAKNRIASVSNWRTASISPLPPVIDTGVSVITKANSKFWRK
ncbi:substrate-binding domain-containing protein [Deinococcus aquiradiocola]|uniref:Sugar ABC transporter substrate-binding protein n=1 Tax=Deinococcus aquiradiocola TaxID=393059 RepID=A0A917UNG6_9DEIO|nr:substrate-binding domain-containing protein [Deinococcus aquiradiocola]GGJ69944.1 sugar ABC transporter substrate-binding protein [Deinococcus aquiradiocola]